MCICVHWCSLFVPPVSRICSCFFVDVLYSLIFSSIICSFDFICLCPFTTPNFPLVCKLFPNVIQPYITINFQDSRREFQHFPLVSPPFFSCAQLPKSHLHLRSHFDRQALALYSWAVIHQLMEVQLGLLFSPTFLDVFPQKTPLIGGDWNMAGLWLSFFWGMSSSQTDFHSIIFQRGWTPTRPLFVGNFPVSHGTISSKKSPQKMRSCQTSMFWDWSEDNMSSDQNLSNPFLDRGFKDGLS